MKTKKYFIEVLFKAHFKFKVKVEFGDTLSNKYNFTLPI